LIIQASKENFVKPTKKLIAEFKIQYERYHDKRYYFTRIKRKGKYMWGLKMWRRARQIEYFKRRRKR